MSLKGKVAVVTGSTSGISLGIARALARADAAIRGRSPSNPSLWLFRAKDEKVR